MTGGSSEGRGTLLQTVCITDLKTSVVNTSLKNLPGPSEQPGAEQNLLMKVHFLEVADASLHTPASG